MNNTLNNNQNSALLALFLLGTSMVFLSADLSQASADEPDVRFAGSRWGETYFPNVELTTHEGEKVRFFDDLIEGKVVMINFIYTRCPDACPLETARLSEVREILGDRVGQDVFMYSISIDPDYDTPEVLKEFTQMYQIGPGWKFLTGDEEDILLLRRKLGLYIAEVNKDPFDHNLSMIIGNQATGRWMKRSPFENPYILATEIGTWLHNYKTPSARENLYQDAPELRTLSQGESLFRTRCAACHNIGRDENSRMKVGPNLLDVTSNREHDWLSRWLKEPDVMLQEKDPIATGLFEAFNRVPMPNLRLNNHEVESLLAFLKIESRRVNKVQQVAALSRQKDAEVPDCCQKLEQMVIGANSIDESGETDTALATSTTQSPQSNTVSESKPEPEESAAPSDSQQSEPTASVRSATRTSPLGMATMLCGLGLGLLAFRLRGQNH
jgi:cytochrome oxidase Cu insertion factor (SCO1/SenC/PrrC family)